MITLVLGGAASGKSEYAENHVLSLNGNRIYIATMEPFDEECSLRINRHREMRRGKGFETIECYRNLGALELPEDANVLLECMTNLTANELYHPEGGGYEGVIQGLEHLILQCCHLTLVTGDVFSGGKEYEGDTLRYLRTLGLVNRWLAKRADRVVEVVFGQENLLKGE